MDYINGDHLCNASYVTDGNGETTQFFLNLPFGETMVEQNLPGAYENPYRFNAKELDRETNLYYYGARYYNPKFSIWYGVDPLAVYNPVMESEFYGDWQHNGGVGFWGNLNPYIYTYQNPIRYIDPNGKQTEGNQVSRFRERSADWVQKNIREPLSGWFDRNTRHTFDLTPEGYAYMAELRKQSGEYMQNNVGPLYKIYGMTGSGMESGAVRGFTRTVIVTNRINKAISFYEKFKGFTSAKIASHIKGIDFINSVEVVNLKKGTKISQWVNETWGIGNYFTNEANTARNLGIGDYNNRVLKTFEVTEDTKVLKSTAADFQGNKGGGTQYFSPDLKNNLKKIK